MIIKRINHKILVANITDRDLAHLIYNKEHISAIHIWYHRPNVSDIIRISLMMDNMPNVKLIIHTAPSNLSFFKKMITELSYVKNRTTKKIVIIKEQYETFYLNKTRSITVGIIDHYTTGILVEEKYRIER